MDGVTNEKGEKGKAPDGFDTEADFLTYVSELYAEDYEADRENIDQAREDLNFTYVDQWESAVRAAREAMGRPCITVNSLIQFVGQVIGDRRINRTSIKVLPNKPDSKREANLRNGLIKSIETFSRAERIYDGCLEDQVVCGRSAFEIALDFSRNDVFEQDIFIRPIENPLATVWDRRSSDPTGRDAQHVFVPDFVSRKDYEKMRPDEDVPLDWETFGEGRAFGDYVSGDDVQIMVFWRMIEKDATFALMADGAVMDVTDKPEEEYLANVAAGPDGQPVMRQSKRSYAQRWLLSAHEILEGPYELPINRLPVIRVLGRVGRVGNKRVTFGLVRWARDPSRLRNYWRSVAAETLAMAPKNQWLAEEASVKGREDAFRKAHLSGDPLLVYNTGRNAPKRQDPPQLPTAVLQESNMNAQDIKDVTGIHDASLGIRSNEVSGKAIMARQREGDVATITFHDNLNAAIQEGGDVVNQLLPLAYDTQRIVRVIGKDDKEEFVKINDPEDADSFEITDMKYDVTVTTGANYTTRRMEAAEFMLETMKTTPELMSLAGDLLIEAQDWPGADAIVERLRKVVPTIKEAVSADDDGGGEGDAGAQPTPEQMMQMQQMQAMQQQQAEAAEMQSQMAGIELERAAAELETAKAAADKMRAQAAEAAAQADEAAAKARKAEADADEAAAKAEKADADALVAVESVQYQRDKNALELQRLRQPQPVQQSRRNAAPKQRANRKEDQNAT